MTAHPNVTIIAVALLALVVVCLLTDHWTAGATTTIALTIHLRGRRD